MAPPVLATRVSGNSDGSVTVSYTPASSGVHDINVTYNDKAVAGVPLRLNVDAQDKHFVTAYGAGLNQGKSGEHLEFFVTGSPSNIDVKIEGPGKVDILKKEDLHGLVRFEYMAVNPGEYNVHIKHKGKPIHGSPFAAKLSGEGRKRSQISSPATSEYTLGGHDIDLANMVGTLKAPNGSTELCLLKKTSDTKLAIASFQPKQKGSYKIDVTQEGKPIKGSPFTISVNDQHVCAAGRVRLHGATSEATANTWNEIQIDISQAGFGSLAMSIEGGHRSDLDLVQKTQTEYILKFKPHEPGVYLLNIKFGDDHVTGSPFMVNVGGQPSGRIRETVVTEVKAVDIAEKNKECHLELKVPGTDPLDMEATVTTPSGQTELCEIRGLGDSLCSLKFKPKEDGVNTISLKYKGVHFAGSPFQYTVGKAPSGGTHRVEFGGPGVEQGEVESKNEFNVYYREGGPGTISIAIEGPSKAKINVVDRGNGYLTVCYVVTKEGDYGVHVKFNDEHVPESPAKVRVLPLSRDAKKVTFVALRDRGIDVNKPVSFSVQLNGAVGELKSHVHTPSGSVEDVYITDIDEDKWALRFTPKENGVFYVDVKLNEAHVPGSPVPFLVGKQASDPALVTANGPGLEKAEAGKVTKFSVQTVNAGAGTLIVQVDGPSKVALVCAEVDEGYDFTYTPLAPGVYMIMIKYSNVTIAGAPFKTVVTGAGKPSEIIETSLLAVETTEKKPGVARAKHFQGDATRVVAKGLGLQKGFTGRSATFTLDVKGAGQALLNLGMIGPSGNPVSELTYKKVKPTSYNVSFIAAEKGDHTLTIHWGADDIPGSPFTIPVA
ncbi:hypothetical protein HELRODRAFT_178024 [Helobdella robusta]|uniref:Uncharacterized protein n=1 Tax=Helobdella robusta TaxID=6412 RepID=T1FCM3_HELRO|nr:hypothetical protein HELRODRAFT_178024 [Helobdella robusta]ESN97587.1 hypothetical protein HELRODRAFT_178024 [Helobdella robusta]